MITASAADAAVAKTHVGTGEQRPAPSTPMPVASISTSGSRAVGVGIHAQRAAEEPGMSKRKSSPSRGVAAAGEAPVGRRAGTDAIAVGGGPAEDRGAERTTTPGMPSSRTMGMQPMPTTSTGNSASGPRGNQRRSSSSAGVNRTCAGATRNHVSSARDGWRESGAARHGSPRAA